MATYISDVPALAPLASGDIEDDRAPAIVRGAPINAENLLASKRQWELREAIAFTLPQPITNEEVAAAERRHHVIKSLHFDVMDGEHVPRWAQQLLERLDEMRDEFRESQRRTEQAVQRSMNRCVKSHHQALEPVIRLLDGTLPANFPATIDDLSKANEATIDEWLLFYGLRRGGTSITKQKRLEQFWGIDL